MGSVVAKIIFGTWESNSSMCMTEGQTWSSAAKKKHGMSPVNT